jgi:Flagellar motor component
MQHLDNIQEVGKGIAVAFVATIYGVGAANLSSCLLPASCDCASAKSICAGR